MHTILKIIPMNKIRRINNLLGYHKKIICKTSIRGTTTKNKCVVEMRKTEKWSKACTIKKSRAPDVMAVTGEREGRDRHDVFFS